ncbi:glycosyltransferase [Neptunicella sp. SCSIO 80796]|uniref:glycosyltransferase n=1 Tax=Neptunicella plasticusilytica TaxID=3117012 RepID=UPI003A4DB254
MKNRLLQLLDHFPQLQAKVIAPVPWFPIKMKKGPLAEYAKFVDVPAQEKIDDIDVLHPRYLVLPKIGMYLTPFFLFLAMWRATRKLKQQGYDFDLIDGHYFYPDGVAITLLAKLFKKPFTVTARGTDINLIPQYPVAKRMVQWVANSADGIITVCQALKDELLTFAPVGNKTKALRNGVDLVFFNATDSQQQQNKKQQWQVKPSDKLIISVGHLIERKGHHLVIESLLSAPDYYLIIAGDGPESERLKQQVSLLKLQDRVRFAGALSQIELRELYQAADALILASSREGWANVLLESMACGTAVVATNLWGTPEVVASKEAGVLVEREPKAIAQGLSVLFKANIQRHQTRQYAERFDWLSTSQGQFELFNHITGNQLNNQTESTQC